MNIDTDTLNAYDPSVLVEFANGETEWFSEMEWPRFDMPDDARVTAFCYVLDAPADGITDQWRQAAGDALVAWIPAAVSWETLDESNDRDISEFVIDVRVV